MAGGAILSRHRREARRWVVQLASRRVTVAEAVRFRRWVADEAHAAAYAEARLCWEVMAEAARRLAANPASPAYRRAPARSWSPSRRWFLRTTAAAVTVGAAALVVHPPLDLWVSPVDLDADYRTGTGERRSVELGRDVRVELTTRSRLALRGDRPDGVVLALLAGEAAVETTGHPVVIAAGRGEASSARGRFTLRHESEGGLVRVTGLEGVVEVRCAGRTERLGPAKTLRYGARGISAVASADVEAATAWQRGVLVFHDQPLRTVIEEVNRYRPGRIILLDDALARRPVLQASFHLDRLDEVVPQIVALYGAPVRRLPGGIVLLG